MEMQIWKIHVTEGVIGASHGFYSPIYEGFVPDLMLTVNQVTSFVNDDHSRYEEHMQEHQFVETPQPELICSIELSRAQIEDLKILASEDDPETRIMKLIGDTLKEKNLDASDYEEKDNCPDPMDPDDFAALSGNDD